MARSFDDESQVALAGEIYCRGNMTRIVCGNGICARSRTPRIQPTGDLGAGDLVPDVERVPEVLHDVSASSAARLGLARREQRLRAKQIAVYGLAQLLPACSVGPLRFGWTYASSYEAAALCHVWQGSQRDRLNNACRHAFK